MRTATAGDRRPWLAVPQDPNWLAHYADHRLGPLWRFHALHHSQEELSVLTSFRAHPLMHTTGFLLATIPIVALMPTRPIAPTQRVNLGVVLTIWDILAGYARFPARGEGVGRTGLEGRPVPVEQDTSASPAVLLLAEQLIEPFRAGA